MSGHRRDGDGPGDPGGVVYAVDRIEGRGPGARVVVIADDGRELDVPLAEFGTGARVQEGAIYRLDPNSLDWRTARRDRAEEERRRADAAAAMERLRRKDPGGDLRL